MNVNIHMRGKCGHGAADEFFPQIVLRQIHRPCYSEHGERQGDARRDDDEEGDGVQGTPRQSKRSVREPMAFECSSLK